MTYTAEELEAELKNTALTRIARKNKGNKEFEKDAGYWTGGACNWGGSHNLKDDCRRLAQNFNKLDGLKSAEQELKKCTSKQEFESVKSRLVRQAEEIEKGLQAKTNSSNNANYVFGICIIWDNYKDLTNDRISLFQNKVKRLKEQISQERYKHYEELRLLKLEEKKITDRMKENKAKAQKENDPAKKSFLLQMIEDDGKKLEENLKKQKAIPASDLKFEPDKYVADLISVMKKAIESKVDKKYKGSNNPDDDSDSDDNIPNKSNNKDESNFFQQNQHLILIGGIATLLVFYLYYSQEEEPNYYDF